MKDTSLRTLFAIASVSASLLRVTPFNAVAQEVATSGHYTNVHDRNGLNERGSVPGPVANERQSLLLRVETFDESFDGVTPPSLPLGWLSQGANGWATTAFAPASLPNALFVGDPASASEQTLITPPFVVPPHGQLRFHHQMDLESAGPGSVIAYDGVVLEIAFDRYGELFDIRDKGGTFASGGYDHIIPLFGSGSTNPLKGRAVWSGFTPGYREVVVNLPSSLAGCTVFVLWDMGTDDSVAGYGYWLDDVKVGVPDEYIFSEGFESRQPVCQ